MKGYIRHGVLPASDVNLPLPNDYVVALAYDDVVKDEYGGAIVSAGSFSIPVPLRPEYVQMKIVIHGAGGGGGFGGASTFPTPSTTAEACQGGSGGGSGSKGEIVVSITPAMRGANMTGTLGQGGNPGGGTGGASTLNSFDTVLPFSAAGGQGGQAGTKHETDQTVGTLNGGAGGSSTSVAGWTDFDGVAGGRSVSGDISGTLNSFGIGPQPGTDGSDSAQTSGGGGSGGWGGETVFGLNEKDPTGGGDGGIYAGAAALSSLPGVTGNQGASPTFANITSVNQELLSGGSGGGSGDTDATGGLGGDGVYGSGGGGGGGAFHSSPTPGGKGGDGWISVAFFTS